MILSAINRRRHSRVEGGFTLVELLVVILILAILIGLLVPAIYGASRTARKAAVSAEINQLASALASLQVQVRRLSSQSLSLWREWELRPMGPVD